MRLLEVTENNTRTRAILKESWQELTEAQQVYLTRFERELHPLMEQLVRVFEAELTPDQIQAIFQGAEETAMASGDNKSALGKAAGAVGAAAKLPVDLMKAVNKKVDELGKLAQKAGPVQNADAKFDQLKKDIMANKPDSKVVQGIQAVSDWAKANPGKASLAVGILTAVAAFAAGPAGGAAAGFLLRTTKGLLQGDKLSSAVGASVKAAAYGALAGAAFEYVTDNVLDNIFTAGDAELDAMEKAFTDANNQEQLADIAAQHGMDTDALDGVTKISMSGNINAFYYNYDVALNPAQMETYNQLSQELANTESFSEEYYKAAVKMHNYMGEVSNNPANIKLTGFFNAIQEAPDTFLSDEQWDAILDKEEDLTKIMNAVYNSGTAAGSAVQAAVTAAEKRAPQAIKAKPVKPEQLELALQGGSDATPVDKNFDKSQKLSDFGPVGDKAESIDMEERFALYLAEADPAQGELPLDNPNSLGAKLKRGVKGVAGKAAAGVKGAAGKAGAAVKQGAKDLGNKVTANKLMKAWKAAGSPTDTGSIVNILQDAGLDDTQISSIGQTAKVDLKPTAANAAAPVDKDGDGKDDNTGKPVEQPAGDEPAKRNPKIKVAKGAGQIAKASDGQSYVWAGAQWVNNATAKVAQKNIAAELGNPKVKGLADQIKQAKLADAVVKMLSATPA